MNVQGPHRSPSPDTRTAISLRRVQRALAAHPPTDQGTQLKFVRRVGASPRERGSTTGQTCPDIFELSDGNFAIIGTEPTAPLESQLPADAARVD